MTARIRWFEIFQIFIAGAVVIFAFWLCILWGGYSRWSDCMKAVDRLEERRDEIPNEIKALTGKLNAETDEKKVEELNKEIKKLNSEYYTIPLTIDNTEKRAEEEKENAFERGIYALLPLPLVIAFCLAKIVDDLSE